MSCSVYLKLLFIAFLLAVLGGAAHVLAVDNYTDWGTISTTEDTTISFEQTDITKNFTDQYSFSILSGTDTSYAVTVTFDVCQNGCGNPEVAYGVYDATGGLVSDTGSVVLSSGDYVLQIKGTGMGAGNETDYSGSITFFVSTVPEPADILLFFTGVAMLGGAWLYRRAGKCTKADGKS